VRLFDAGARGDEPQVVHDRVLTVPNAITALRLAGLPLFAWLLLGADRPLAAFVTLALVATTDWVDGYVARRFNQVSRLGKLMDPLVDRVLIVTAALVLALAGILPWGVIMAVAVRDVAVVGGALVLFGGIPPIPVTRLGKVATACLLAALPSFLLATLDWAGADLFGVLAVVLAALGLLGYYGAGLQYARLAAARKRSSAATGHGATRS
jgi:cardiolipin synthase (CMP-forming)